MRYSAKAPGKLILIGEYAVLEGGPALVTSVDRYAKTTIRRNNRNLYSVESPTLQIAPTDFTIDGSQNLIFSPELPDDRVGNLQLFIKIFKNLIEGPLRDVQLTPVSIQLNTDEFFLSDSGSKLGLGSSAALTVALINAFFYFYQDVDLSTTNRRRLFEYAAEIHQLMQGGKGSGIDIASSTFGQIIRFSRQPHNPLAEADIQVVEELTELFVIPVWTGHSASTTQMINQVESLKISDSSRYWKLMDKLAEVSSQACEAYKAKKIQDFLALIEQYFQSLSVLTEQSQADIISPVHKRIAALVRKSGGYYKPSGAGGGDIGLAFTDSQSIYEKVRDMILHSEFGILNLRFNQMGAMIVS